jgi:hypothetical protein
VRGTRTSSDSTGAIDAMSDIGVLRARGAGKAFRERYCVGIGYVADVRQSGKTVSMLQVS